MTTDDFTDFAIDLRNQIKTKAVGDGEGTSVAFLKIFTDALFEGDILSTECIPAYFKGVGKHNRSIRVDGYTYDELDATMSLIISDYEDTEEREVLTKTDVDKIFDKLRYFVDEVLSGTLQFEESNPVSDLAGEIKSKTQDTEIRKYKFLLITNATMSSRIKEIESEDLFGIPVEQQIWDLNRYYQLVSSDTGRETIAIDFNEYGGGVPCIEACGVTSNDYRSYLCVISGDALASIYDKYGGRLLEENVRMFLSNKSGVNKKIRKTIHDEPEKFFAYNNGISVTVRDAKFQIESNGMKIIQTEDFQIINGGQTTASLSQARYKDDYDLSNIKVPMKLTWLIDTDPDKVNALVRNISYSANSQNKVTDADFFSTHPYHLVMEKLSRKIYAPAVGGVQYSTQWYYERVRGQYVQAMARMTAAEKRSFVAKTPKEQKFDKNILSKVRNTWKMKPDVVSKGAMFNIKEFADGITKTWDDEKDLYDETYFKESVALLIMFTELDKMIPKLDWYKGGYKGNIVTYTLALFHKLLQDQYSKYEFNLMYIWNKQSVPDIVLKYLRDLSYIVYEIITDEDRPVENVTQWCKRSKCWDEVRTGAFYKIEDAILPFLISKKNYVAI